MKILFVGNIANNAYLLAKYLREKGHEADVLCYNYYDIMACPEWEDAEISGDWGFNEHPRWHQVSTGNFKRPDWFVQGPLDISIRFLLGKSHNDKALVGRYNFTAKPRFAQKYLQFWRPADWRFVRQEYPFIFLLCLPVFFFACLSKYFSILFRKCSPLPGEVTKNSETRYSGGVNVYLAGLAPAINELFSRYDIVQAHATDPIFPYLLGKHPYVALEHGTIRQIPFQDDFIGTYTKLSYQNADHVFITNADNIAAAERLEIKKFSFLPHPVNPVSASEYVAASLRNEHLERLDSNYIVFHPSRQHWDEKLRHPDWEKGNDIFIRGFAKFAKEINPKASAVFVEWGQKLEETKALLSGLGIADRIIWVKPLPHIEMTKYIKACDMVADQFWIGAFGAITPKAMMCGRAVLLKLDEEIHKKAFPELPPVLNAKTPEEVFSGLKRHYEDKSFRQDIERRSSDWFNKYHCDKVITDKLLKVYENLLRRDVFTKS